MITDNNTWKQKALTPIVLKDSNDSFNTVKDLLNAIANDEILNIAVTGPYGSGKSSVIKTFKERVDKDVKVLDISLATLDADASLYAAENTTTAGDNGKDIQQPTITAEQKEILNRKIEFSILQQLVYRKTLETLPFSRLRKIRHFSKHTIQTMAMYVVGAVVLIAFVLQLDFMQIPLFYETFGIPITAQHVISIVSIILLLTMMYETVVYIIKNYGGIHLQKISIGGNEIDIHDDGSIFNRHLDEILYFFQCTDYNVVIIEDLDRFNTTDIFLKLRELNHLINKSEMIGRTIKFVYAVKDDMFKDSSRSKFFDYITTVIPVITTINSRDMLKRALKEQGHDGEVADDDIRDIAFHIDDMRLLYNIVNEYHQYMQRLDKNGQHLEAKKMLAMMTVKNYHPHDFSGLHNRKGRLYDILSPQTKRKFVDIAINKRIAERIKQAEEQLAAYDATCHLQEKELRLAYLVAIYEKLSNGTFAIIVDDTDYTLSQIADDAGLFEKLISKDTIYYKYSNHYYNNRKDDQYIDFHNIEKNVNEQFTYHQRVEQIGKDRGKLEKELQNTNLEKQRIGTYTISELLEMFNLYEDESFKGIGLSDMEEDFVRHGFIAEDYNDYIAYFYPDIMSLADHQLCLDMKLNRKPAYDSTIDNIELFLKELPETALRYESVWNFHILDYIVMHPLLYDKILNLIGETLVSKSSANFLYQYYLFNENGANKVVGFCVKKDGKSMWEKFYSTEEKEKNTLLALWLRNCTPKYIDELQHLWLKQNYDFIASMYTLLSKETQVYVTTKVDYDELTNTDPNMLELVIENGCYVLNEHNMPIVVNKKHAKDDITKLKGLEEMKLAVQLELVTISWHNVYKFFKESDNAVSDDLIKWIENNIQKLCKDDNYKIDSYSDLFQSLYEVSNFSDAVYKKLCKLEYWSVDLTNAVLDLPISKLRMLVQFGAFEYNLDTLKSLHEKDAILSCEYMFFYKKDHLSEMLKVGIMNSSLAEALLIHTGFDTQEYEMIVGALTYDDVPVTIVIANKICALQATQFSICDEDILYDAINLCEDEHDAVFTAGRLITEKGNDESMINTIISNLPDVYHALSERDKQIKLRNTDYNRFLVEKLKDADYISLYSIKKKEIVVNTKQEN
jgi:dephospho-CoA kinase